MAEECSGGSSIKRSLLIMVVVLLIMIMLQPDLRMAFGEMVGIVLEPLIGFNGQLAVVSMMLAGFITGTISIVIRHFTTDWIAVAKSQKAMSEFNKVYRETLMSGNQAKLEKLQKVRQETMAEFSGIQMSQLKTLAFTMFAVIIIFAWLFSFVGSGVVSSKFSVPWSYDADMTEVVIFIPQWVLLYAVLSSPLTLLLPRILKYYSYKKKLEAEEYEDEGWEDESAVD
ncbi:MAG: DUF106 domain-containing protein [Thermoplasmata archaeon]|nr:DUF106 domain-containing protein [Thermoplasmata archaeon]